MRKLTIIHTSAYGLDAPQPMRLDDLGTIAAATRRKMQIIRNFP